MTEDDFDPYGYPCGAHTHATPRARIRCQGLPEADWVPELGLCGMTWTYRGTR